MCGTAIWCSRMSSARTASARCCSASSRTAMLRPDGCQCVKHVLNIGRAAAPSGMVIKIAIRSVGIRRLFSDSGAARRGDRRRAHRADDPPLSRLMAPDDRRDNLDPARDADLAGRAVLPRRDDRQKIRATPSSPDSMPRSSAASSICANAILGAGTLAAVTAGRIPASISS